LSAMLRVLLLLLPERAEACVRWQLLCFAPRKGYRGFLLLKNCGTGRFLQIRPVRKRSNMEFAGAERSTFADRVE
jgi:hypothetical protein